MAQGIKNPVGQCMQVDLESILATRPSLTPQVLAEIDGVTKHVLYTKIRYDLALRADIMGSEAKIDVDSLFRDLIEGEGDEDIIRDGTAGSFGVTEWG